MLTKVPGDEPGTVQVTFSVLSRVDAERVAVVGDFNGWSPDRDLLAPADNGSFSRTVELEVGRHYRFRYLLDGERWENDPQADEYVPNDFGGDMARAMWSGSISFGLVNVPVKAYSAVRDHKVHFHQLEARSGARIRNAKVSGTSGKPVDDDKIERGFEVSKKHYVVVDDAELEELKPRTTRTIDISDFVELAAVDPIYYERTYWLGADGEGAARSYRLLLAAMEDAGRVGVGTVVMRNKQYLAAIRPLDGALAMSTMRFADEVVPHSKVDGIPSARSKPAPKELRLAAQIIDSLTADWKPSRYHDTYTEELRRLLTRKAKGQKIKVEATPEPSEAKVVDLMEALEASIRGRKKAARPTKKRAKKSA
jgi:DNA end-binding protein Ku